MSLVYHNRGVYSKEADEELVDTRLVPRPGGEALLVIQRQNGNSTNGYLAHGRMKGVDKKNMEIIKNQSSVNLTTREIA